MEDLCKLIFKHDMTETLLKNRLKHGWATKSKFQKIFF